MIDAASQIADWEDTAAAVWLLDHAITVDNAVVHVTGAMGKPDGAAAFAPDWRWRAEGEATPWSPSMRLLRQTRRGDWSDALVRARESIAAAA
jgi:hypothetical protein